LIASHTSHYTVESLVSYYQPPDHHVPTPSSPPRRSSDLPYVAASPNGGAVVSSRSDVGATVQYVNASGGCRNVLSPHGLAGGVEDRKSTRLNSSHVEMSYGVFCLKKKISHTSR